MVLYVVELQNLSTNQSRQFNISLNGKVKDSATNLVYLHELSPTYFSYYWQPNKSNQDIVFSLVQLSDSTLPPILNGMEVYWEMLMENDLLTSRDDGKKSFLL